MRELIIPIQSKTDVITNSSSELFVISDPKEDIAILRDIITGLGNKEEKSSGMGGEITILTAEKSFWGNCSTREEFYDWPLNTVNYSWGGVGEDDDLPECGYLLNYGEKEEPYSVAQLQSWFSLPMSEIFDIYLEHLTRDIKMNPGIIITPNSILIHIDWAMEGTIEQLKEKFGALELLY